MTINSATGAISWTPAEGDTTSGAVTITVTDDGTGTLTDTETFTVAVTAVNDAGTVSIAGTVTQGETLTANVADADGATGTITYQWKANGVDISGATSNTYVLTQNEVGKKITVTATYTDDGTTAETPTSAETSAAANVNDAGAVTITGAATQGETLTANVVDADGATGTITYQWKADGSDISGATNQTFVLTPAEVGKTLTVIVTYTDDGNTAETLTSQATASVVGVSSGNGAASIPTLSQWVQYLLILMLALLGGRAHFLKKRKSES